MYRAGTTSASFYNDREDLTCLPFTIPYPRTYHQMSRPVLW